VHSEIESGGILDKKILNYHFLLLLQLEQIEGLNNIDEHLVDT